MSTVLTLNASTAKELYPSASKEFKVLLTETFGKDFFQGKITDRIKTVEDACKVLSITTTNVYDETIDTPHDAAYKQLQVVIRALNEGWKPDWKNASQPKYYPWFYMDETPNNSQGFLLSDVRGYCALSSVGSRLCFRSRELAEYAATQFKDLYQTYLTA